MRQFPTECVFDANLASRTRLHRKGARNRFGIFTPTQFPKPPGGGQYRRHFHEPPFCNLTRTATTSLRLVVKDQELPPLTHQTATHSAKGTNPTVPCPRFPRGHELRSKPRCVLGQPFSQVAPGSGFATACLPARTPPASSTTLENFEPGLAPLKRWPSSL